MNLNELAKKIHVLNKKWWTDAEGFPIVRNRGELLMLAITELAEAVEGIRKNLNDDHLPQFKMEVVEMADCKIRLLDWSRGFNVGALYPVMLSDLPTRFIESDNKSEKILNICGEIYKCYSGSYIDTAFGISVCVEMIHYYCDEYGLPLFDATDKKLIYNQSRQDHTHEARAAVGGKAF